MGWGHEQPPFRRDGGGMDETLIELTTGLEDQARTDRTLPAWHRTDTTSRRDGMMSVLCQDEQPSSP